MSSTGQEPNGIIAWRVNQAERKLEAVEKSTDRIPLLEAKVDLMSRRMDSLLRGVWAVALTFLTATITFIVWLAQGAAG